MPSPKGDPTYIKNKEYFFIEVALTIAKASSHPKAPGGCVIVRDKEIVGDGRSILTDSGVEIDPITYAIGTAAKRGTPLVGGVIYTTRYPFSNTVFQSYLLGIRKIVVLAHEWEPFYKDEFRRAARLARELCIAIEPVYPEKDPRLQTKTELPVTDKDLIDPNLLAKDEFFQPDEYDAKSTTEIYDD